MEAMRVARKVEEIAQWKLGDYGWDEEQFGCLDELWTNESNREEYAENPSSGAYGIPQALPPREDGVSRFRLGD